MIVDHTSSGAPVRTADPGELIMFHESSGVNWKSSHFSSINHQQHPKECLIISDGTKVWFQGSLYTFCEDRGKADGETTISPELLTNGDLLQVDGELFNPAKNW